MGNVSVKGVALGVIATSILTSAFATVFVLNFSTNTFAAGMTPDEIEKMVTALIHNNYFLYGSLISGMIITVIGGFVAAKIAKKAVYLNSGLVGLCITLPQCISVGEFPFWFSIASFFSIIPAALLGGDFANS